jgi:hypothetical protein
MPSTRSRSTFLYIIIAVVVLLAIIPAGQVWGNPEKAPSGQDATGYPDPVETGYPGEPTSITDPGYPFPEQPTLDETAPTEGSGTFVPIASPTQNPLTPSPTAGRNLFGTEDSEMGNSLVTPPPSETPVPSPTLTPTTTPSVTPGFVQGFQLNRQLFTLGFVLPLGMLILGWLGYRLLRTGEFKGN